MEISFIQVILINMALTLTIAASATYFIVKGFSHLMLEKDHKDSINIDASDSEYGVIIEQLSLLRHRFFISFFILELSIIAYFVFWGLMFYYNARILM